MNVTDLIVKKIADAGITHVFGVYGSACTSLFDAFHRIPGIKHVCTTHEAVAGFAAEGYQKAGKPFGVAICTSGPAATNMVTPIYNCWADSVPCLFIIGQVATRLMRTSSAERFKGFQEAPTVDIVSPISKYAVTVVDPQWIR